MKSVEESREAIWFEHLMVLDNDSGLLIVHYISMFLISHFVSNLFGWIIYNFSISQFIDYDN